MINIHENINVNVCWDDVSFRCSNTRVTVNFKICQNYSQSTLAVACIHLRSYSGRQRDADCCLSLNAPAQEKPRKSKGPAPRFTNITTKFLLRVNKTENKAYNLHYFIIAFYSLPNSYIASEERAASTFRVGVRWIKKVMCYM
jgi:hypothetical protein